MMVNLDAGSSGKSQLVESEWRDANLTKADLTGANSERRVLAEAFPQAFSKGLTRTNLSGADSLLRHLRGD